MNNYEPAGRSDKRDYNGENRINYDSMNRVQPRSYSQDSNVHVKRGEPGYMSNYGSNLMRAMPGKDQDRVYERQQIPYNIISCYPREAPSVHRKFPKLTLENKLIETGHYGFNPEGF